MRDSLEGCTTPWHSVFLDSHHFLRGDLRPLWDLIRVGFRVHTLSSSSRRRRHYLAPFWGSTFSPNFSITFSIFLGFSGAGNTMVKVSKLDLCWFARKKFENLFRENPKRVSTFKILFRTHETNWRYPGAPFLLPFFVMLN